MQTECGCRREVNVRRRCIVERNAEHLSDLASSDCAALRLIDPVITARRLARSAHIDDAANDAVYIYPITALRALDRRLAGKSRDVSFPRLQTTVLSGRPNDRGKKKKPDNSGPPNV